MKTRTQYFHQEAPGIVMFRCNGCKNEYYIYEYFAIIENPAKLLCRAGFLYFFHIDAGT